jgi:uncharacterized membrane protein
MVMRTSAGVTSPALRLGVLLRARWLRWLLVGGLLALYAGWIGFVVLGRNKPVDFYVYYSGALAVRQGRNLFELSVEEWIALGGFPGIADQDVPYPHRYPPFYHVLMLPLTLLPPRTAAALWAAGSALAFLGAAWVLARTFRSAYTDLAIWTLLGLSVPALAALHAGQVTPFVLLCLAVALSALVRRRDYWAGVALGVGVLLKLIPLALVAWALWRQRFRVALTALALVSVFNLICLPIVGMDDYASFVRQSAALTRADRLTINPPNQSLGGFIGRFSQRWPADTQTYLRLIRFVNLAFVAATALLCWPPGRLPSRRPERLALEFGLIVAALQLVTPFAWLHQLHLLLVPLSVLAHRAMSEKAERWLALPIGIAVLLTDVHGLFWHQLQAWNPYSVFLSLGTLGTLIIWGTLAALLIVDRRCFRAHTGSRKGAATSSSDPLAG